MTGEDLRDSDHRAAGRRTPLVQACWNLRLLGLFLVGPLLGVLLAGEVFGMTPSLYLLAGLVFSFTLSMYALLIRGEWRRLSIDDPR